MAAVVALSGGVYLIATEPSDEYGYVFAVGGLLWFLARWLGLRIWARSYYRKQRAIPRGWTHEIDDSKLKSNSEKASSEMSWSAFTQFIETKNLFLLYSDNQLFQIFPKRVFGTDDLVHFRDILSRHLPSAKP